jgi:hypothetical protein
LAQLGHGSAVEGCPLLGEKQTSLFRLVCEWPLLAAQSGHSRRSVVSVAGQRFQGLKKLTLNNMVQDKSMIHETLAYASFRSAGVRENDAASSGRARHLGWMTLGAVTLAALLAVVRANSAAVVSRSFLIREDSTWCAA